MKATLIRSSAITVLLATPALAQEDPHHLGNIILSGGLSPIEASAYGRAVSVISESDLEERGITNMRDALRVLPGVAVNGTGDSFTQVRIRGGEANHTLILVDGVEIAAGDGEYILSGLETSNVERIEVLRGPQSAFYGANASSGVINIITKEAEPGAHYGFTLGAGGASIATALLSQRGDRGGVAASLSYSDDAGFDNSGDGGEKDGIERKTLQVTGDYDLTDDLTVGLIFRRSSETYDYDSIGGVDEESYVVDDPIKYSDREELLASLWAEYDMLDGRMKHRLAFATTRNEQSYDGGLPTETQTDSAKYRLSYGLDGQVVADSSHLLNAMVEWENASSSSNPDYYRETTSYAIEYRGQLIHGLDVQAGVRFDDNSAFEDFTTWNLGLSYQFDSGIRLHASAGTGVVNPSYFELFANDWGYTGNPDLAPEENQSFDIGVELPIFNGRGILDVTYFNETLTNEIYAEEIAPFTYVFANQSGNSDRQGLEIAGSLQATDRLALRLGYTYLDATEPDGSIEIRRPQHELTLGATLKTADGLGSLSAELRHVAGNYDTQSWLWPSTPKVEMPAFTTVDVAARYQIAKGVDLTGRVTNLFDAEASEAWGYAARGRTVYVGLSAAF